MSTEIDEQKQNIRVKVKALKAAIPFEKKKELSDKILSRLEKDSDFIKAHTVMLYWSMKDEVHTHDFILKWASSKRIILPSVAGDKLILKEFTGVQNMVAGQGFGILEPIGTTFDFPEEIDVIIVPGVAFDKQNNRLGRGKAFYDKLLKQTNAKKIGICFNFQFLESVPVDEFDVKMDKVISD